MNSRNRIAIIVLTIALIVTFMPLSAMATPTEQTEIDAGAEASSGDAGETKCLPGGTFDLVTLDDVAGGQPVANHPGGRRGLGAKSTVKEMPLLIVVIGFKDTPYNEEYDWGNTIFSAKSGAHSISRFYTDNSQGKFTFAPARESSSYNNDGNTNTKDRRNDGIVHVSVEMNHDDWTDVWREGGSNQGTWADALKDAMSITDSHVNFSNYDANGNGSIETNEMALGFIVAGGEGSNYDNYGTDAKYLTWAHAWEMADFMSEAPTCDNKTINKYIAIAEDIEYERDDDEINATQAGIGTLAHELGHYLGLPDYYDVNYDTGGPWGKYEVGRASIMASGNWCYIEYENGGWMYTPSPFDACSRVVLGWVEPIVAELENTYTLTAQNYSANPSNSGYNVLKIPTTNEKEYYLIENKQFSGWDEALRTAYPEGDSFAKSGGLVMWHVDEGILSQYWEDNEINTTYHRPGIMPTFMEQKWTPKCTYYFTGLMNKRKIFFDESIYYSRFTPKESDNIKLPVYNPENDKPSARTSSPYNLVLRGTGNNIRVIFTERQTSEIVAEEQSAARAAAEAKARALAAASNINKATVTAADVQKASKLGATTITLGKKVKKVKKNAFRGTNITTVIVKTKKLKAKSVKGSLKGSKVRTVKVAVGSKKANKKYIKKYKKIFTKKNAGKKVKTK